MEDIGSVNNGYTNCPKSQSSTSLISPYAKTDVQFGDRMLSIDSGIGSNSGASSDDEVADDVNEALEEDREEECMRRNKTMTAQQSAYLNENVGTYTTPQRSRNSLEAKPEYEDLNVYREKVGCRNSSDSRVYTLPTCSRPPTGGKNENERFSRLYSLPDATTVQQQQQIENRTIRMVDLQNSGYTIPAGKKKSNLLYEKTKVIKTNSLTFSTAPSPLPSFKRSSNVSKRNARLKKLFTVLNVIFGIIAVIALILGIVVYIRQENLTKDEKLVKAQMEMFSSTKDSFGEAVKSLNSATKKITKINGNMGDVNSTLQHLVDKVHHVIKLQNQQNTSSSS